MGKNNNRSIKKSNIIKYCVIVFIILVIFSLSISLILYKFTNFEKIIIVRDKYIRPTSGSNYNIVDTDGNIYQIDNLWFRFDYNRAEDYAKIILNEKYIVNGYGFRSGFLNSYKKIYSVRYPED
jgi:hypothetical protein